MLWRRAGGRGKVGWRARGAVRGVEAFCKHGALNSSAHRPLSTSTCLRPPPMHAMCVAVAQAWLLSMTVYHLMSAHHALQISGTISREDGTPVYKLEGKWNEYLDAGGCRMGGGWAVQCWYCASASASAV